MDFPYVFESQNLIHLFFPLVYHCIWIYDTPAFLHSCWVWLQRGPYRYPRNHGLNLILNKSAKCAKPKQKSNKKIQNPWKSTLLYNFLWIFVQKIHHVAPSSKRVSPNHQLISPSAHCQKPWVPNRILLEKSAHVTRRPTHTPVKLAP